VNPDIDGEVVAGRSGGFAESELPGVLKADFLSCFKLGIGPVEEAKREILVGQVGSGNGLGELVAGKVDGLAVDDFEEIVFVIVQAEVEYPPCFAFEKLELYVFALEEDRDGRLFAVVGQVSLESAIEFNESGTQAGTFKNAVRIGRLGFER